MSPAIESPKLKEFELSNGEIHFLWCFIQGSIMVPEIRHKLRKAWGFCERHAWAFISIEATFRSGYMHGPALLYEDIMACVNSAFPAESPLKKWNLGRKLRPRRPCPMCEWGFGPETKGTATQELVETGRDTHELYTFAHKTKAYWERTMCG